MLLLSSLISLSKFKAFILEQGPSVPASLLLISLCHLVFHFSLNQCTLLTCELVFALGAPVEEKSPGGKLYSVHVGVLTLRQGIELSSKLPTATVSMLWVSRLELSGQHHEKSPGMCVYSWQGRQ